MDIGQRVRELSERHKAEFVELFKRCHRYPEVSMKEFETTAYIRRVLESLGIRIIEPRLETGVVALLEGGKPGPCVAIRADIDALPVLERSGVEYASLNEGAMHACGHDTHYGSLLCAAMILSELREEIHGSVKFIFEPAEEINNGAKRLIPAGCLENPRVEAVFSFHNSPEIPTGTVACIPGPIMASVDDIVIRLKGKGGHGGIPHRNTDPIVAMAAVIQALQTIVSRNVSPTDSGVVSICSVKAGTVGSQNVIPDEAVLYGTVRAYDNGTRHRMWQRVREISEGVGAAFGTETEVEIVPHLDVTDNRPVDGHRDLYGIALKAVEAAGAVPVRPDPSGGGDDFCQYMTGVDGHPGTAGFFYWLGVRNEEKGCVHSWHSPMYKADTDAIPIGASLFALSALIAGEELAKEETA